MQRLYAQIRVDETKLRYYAACPQCGARRYAGKLPASCPRTLLPELAAGTAEPRRQRAYHRGARIAARRLARYFNRCRLCAQWVCDACYDVEDDLGACRQCSTQFR